MAGIARGAFNLALPLLKEIGFKGNGDVLLLNSKWTVDGLTVYATIKPTMTEREIVGFDFVVINAGQFPRRRFQYSLTYRLNIDGALSLADGVIQNLRPNEREAVEQLTAFLTESFRSKKGMPALVNQTAVAATSGRR